MNMQVTERDDRVCVIRVSGQLDAWHTLPVGGEVHRVVNEDPRWVVLDMSDVEMLTSAGLSVLIQCNRALIATGHGLILVGCIPDVKRVLREARLHEALLAMPSFDEAILSLSGETIEMC